MRICIYRNCVTECTECSVYRNIYQHICMYVNLLTITEGTGEWEGDMILDDYNKMELQIEDIEDEME